MPTGHGGKQHGVILGVTSPSRGHKLTRIYIVTIRDCDSFRQMRFEGHRGVYSVFTRVEISVLQSSREEVRSASRHDFVGKIGDGCGIFGPQDLNVIG